MIAITKIELVSGRSAYDSSDRIKCVKNGFLVEICEESSADTK